MELNMPIRAVKVKPIANIDFILTCMRDERLVTHFYITCKSQPKDRCWKKPR